MERAGAPGEGLVFADPGEIGQALFHRRVTLHSKAKARVKSCDQEGKPVTQVIATTPGRVLLSEILPRHPNVPFKVLNQLLTKKEISNIIDVVYRHCGQKETVIFADRLMTMGFTQACKAGISFGQDDLVIPLASTRPAGEP